LKERQNKESREKAREERQHRVKQLHRARLERRINREIRKDILEEIPVVNNPTYSPSHEQLKSPLHFINLIASGEEGELVSSPGLPNPQNSPKGSRHPTPPHLQTPPATTFFSAFTSRLERAVQQIVSPSRERQYEEGINLAIINGFELQNLPNNEEPLDNSGFLGDRGVRNLFPTPSLPLPIDVSYPTIDEQFNGLPAIARPIEEILASPLNQSFLTNSPLTPQYLLNQLNWDQSQTETEIEPEELYLAKGVEQFQSPDFVPQLQDIPEDNHRRQIGYKTLKVNEANTSLPLEIHVLPIVVRSNMKGNVERREINTS
jgi:hypothetical protein